MRMMNHKLESRLLGEISETSDIQIRYHSKKSLLMRVKQENEKALKLNIQKTKIMVSGLFTSWQIDGETMEAVTDFIFLASKITADGDYSHKIDICLLLGRKGMTKPKQHIKKQRHYFADKGPSSQSYGFSSSHARV